MKAIVFLFTLCGEPHAMWAVDLEAFRLHHYDKEMVEQAMEHFGVYNWQLELDSVFDLGLCK